MSAPFEFAVDDAQSERFEVARQMLREGEPVSYRGISLSLLDPGFLDCAVVTQWDPQSITTEIARAEMQSGRSAIEDLIAASPSFASTVAGRKLRVSLIGWDGMSYTRFACADEKT